MITVIAGTDRPESNSAYVANQYVKIAKEQGVDADVLLLKDLPGDFFSAGSYGDPADSFAHVLHKLLIPSTHLLFVVPEYNGGFPGVLKHFIDIIHPKIWEGKVAALTGIATGRSGNLRGLDHLTGILHYLKVDVLYQKPYLSSIHLHMDKNHEVTNTEYLQLMSLEIKALIDKGA